jgi:uncharacterized membrane protein YqjE
MNSESPIRNRTSTFSHAAELFASVAEYFAVRLRLAGIEAKEAGAQYGLATGMIALGAFAAVLGYIFLVITAVFAIAAAFDEEHAWLWIMGGAAVLHLGGATALVLIAIRRLKAGAFSHTIEEFKKDQTWLRNLASNH